MALRKVLSIKQNFDWCIAPRQIKVKEGVFESVVSATAESLKTIRVKILMDLFANIEQLNIRYSEDIPESFEI